MPAYPFSPFGVDPNRSGGRVRYVNDGYSYGQDFRQPMRVFNGSAPIGANAGTATPMFGGAGGSGQPFAQPRQRQSAVTVIQQPQQPVNPSYSPPGAHSQNFLDSVRRNNFARYSAESGRALNYGDPSYGGQLIDKARNFAPPEGPTVVMGGGRGGQPFYVPPGANVVMPGGGGGAGMGGASKPFNPVDRSNAYKNYLGRPLPLTDKTGAITGYNYVGLKPEDALRGADEDSGLRARPGDATTQPTAQPFLPPDQARAAENQRFSAGAGEQNHIQITQEHARAMWTGLMNINPPGTPFEKVHEQFKTMLAGYGVSGETADRLAGGWMDKGTDRQTNFAPQSQPNLAQPSRVPLSMLGASNGMDPAQNYGAPRQATPGPSIASPVAAPRPQQEVALAPQGYTPLPQQQAVAQGQQQRGPTTQPTQQLAQATPPMGAHTATNPQTGERFYHDPQSDQWVKY